MNKETQKAAAEMLVQEYLSRGATTEAEEMAGQAGRSLTEAEARQLFEKAIILKNLCQAIRAAGLISSLSKGEKDRLLHVCWFSDFFSPALKVTGTILSEEEFHRLVSQADKSSKSQAFIIGLVRETGYALTNREKEAFLNCMIECQRGKYGYDGRSLREGLQFLGDWLSPEGAERLFTALEDYQSPEIALDSMVELAVLARGKINKYRILNRLSLVTSKLRLKDLEAAVQRATGESLLLDNYRHLFNAAIRQKDHYMSAEIARKHPEIIKEHEFDDLISLSIKRDGFYDTVSIVEAAAKAGKLSLESLKLLISKAQNPGYHVSFRIFIYALALERGINPKDHQSAAEG